MPEPQAMKPPTLRDALVGLACVIVVDALLIGQAFLMLRLEAGKSTLLAAFPVMSLVALGVPTVALLRYLKRRKISLGFNRLGAKGWHLLWEFPVAVLFAGTAASLIGPLVGFEPTEKSTLNDGTSLGIMFTLATYLLIGPFLEEIVFRRLLMGYLDTVAPVLVSVVVSSVIFGIAHIAPAAMIYTGFMGIALALTTRWHKSLWAGFLVHFCNNLLVQIAVLSGA